MSARRGILLAIVVLMSLAAFAKDKPKYKSVEVKRFVQAEGVELSPQFSDFLYAELKTELHKSGLFEDVLTEDEVVDAADAPRSFVVEGTVLEYKKGSLAKEAIIGFGVGRRSLRAQLSVHRRSDNQSVLAKELKVRTTTKLDEKLLARALAKDIVNELKHELNES